MNSIADNNANANTPPIYLDNQATTRVDPRVIEAMLPYFTEHFGNPHSTSHSYGHVAAAAVEDARAEIAALIHADPREIVFTSGATEANNLAIKGAAHFARAYPHAGGVRDHIVTLTTEHKCVLESCAQLEREGFDVTYRAGRARRLGGARQARSGIDRPHSLGLGSGRAQRDRRDPAARRDRCAVPRPRRAVPYRRGAGRGQDPARRRSDAYRPDVDFRAQALRPKGCGRALRPPPAARAPAAVDRRRRPGARFAVRHLADAALRRARPRRSNRRRRNGGRGASPAPAARPAASGPGAPGSGARSQRRSRAAVAGQSQPELSGDRGRPL